MMQANPLTPILRTSQPSTPRLQPSAKRFATPPDQLGLEPDDLSVEILDPGRSGRVEAAATAP